jgi:hypothetical protein
MESPDEYRIFAAECRRMAASTRNDDDKRSWLQLAERWVRMMGPSKRTTFDTFAVQGS